MDIDLLSKMVKELILDKDEVALPGAGVFVAEVVPSTFSDKGYTINPPYRKLSFRQRENAEDTSLVDFYAESNKCSRADAEKVIRGFLSEMLDVLREKKTIIFPGLGRLRATRENNFFFVADEDLDIYPAGFGLSPISLKTHEETGEEVTAAVTGLADMLAEPVAGTSTSPAAAEPEKPAAEAPAEPVVPESPATAGPESAETEKAPEQEKPVAEIPAEPNLVVEPVGTPVAAEPEKSDTEAPVEPNTAVGPVGAPVAAEPEKPAAETPAEPEASWLPGTPVDMAESVADTSTISATAESAHKHKALKTMLIVIAAFAALLVLYVIFARLFPGLMDSLLYNQEQLEILRHE